MKGKFIVIEGIDGCGKTTQIDELSKWLPNSGLMKKSSKLITTREPGGSLLGKKLRGLILDNNENNKPSSLAELLLYSADRAEHVSKIIAPALKNNDWDLVDIEMCNLGNACGTCHASFRRLLTNQLANEASAWSGKYINKCD